LFIYDFSIIFVAIIWDLLFDRAKTPGPVESAKMYVAYSPASGPILKVSVVIPVWNKADLLRLCLDHLKRQTYPSDSYEIIVVDNGSDDEIAFLHDEYPEVRWFREENPSSYAARNCGLRHAAGEIIAFTDADCLPTPTWLENSVGSLRSSGASIVGGDIRYVMPSDRELNVYELLEEKLFGMGNHRRLIEVRGFAVTANLVAYRSVFEKVGCFDSDLKSSGDREWKKRAISMGERLSFAESALIYHPRRGSWEELSRKQRRIVGGRLTLMRKTRPPFEQVCDQLYAQSLFDLKMYQMALSHPDIKSVRKRIKFVAAVASMCAVTTFERIRLLLGGDPRRS
jgi:glycosyltransferase involved in cell wall biosynthesis